jgi:EAL domain-containing protein (putative c-di-GMP-specific phosphodiesterase class I)
MYAAKHRGGGLAFYAGETEPKPAAGLGLLADLRRALDSDHARKNDEMGVCYQPEVSIRSGDAVGVEALLNWRRDGRVDLEEVIRVGEHTPVMRRLTVWIVNEVMDRLVAWQEAGLRIRTSVKISGRDLESTEVTDLLIARLRRDAISHELIALEIGEEALMAEPGRFHKALRALAGAGIALWLDDFGTGHTSMRDLRRLPLTGLKIDRSLVGRITSDPDTDAVVRAIIDLGRVLDLRVVAKGVDDEATHRLLAAHQCPIGQGPYYAEPMTDDALTAWLDKARPSNGSAV